MDRENRCPNCGSQDIRRLDGEMEEGRGSVSFGCFGCLGGIPLAFFWPLRRRQRRDRATYECRTCGWRWRV